MPGILPMKVIKVGSSAQSRIAQACDRCRSKKIRCDGVRPTCSQCANVGFECRTSDKLSRRAFPRGYTESLEERIRQLESEVRELKDLLDEKDEKIDMLSAMRGSRHPRPPVSPATNALPSPDTSKGSPVATCKEDSFRVQSAPLLLGVENSDSYLMGPSSGRSFIVSFKQKLQEMGRPCAEFNPEAFLHVQGCAPLVREEPSAACKLPPRILSDRCVNVYFQELAPLFPVLHKPTFLHMYEEFLAGPEKVKCHHKIAQLFLVFSIAGISSESPDLQQLAACEQQWDQAIQAMLLENTMNSLQCLVLALLYCTIRADHKRVQHYKGLAVGLSHRLGLHQSQRRFTFGALTLETRKKVFWTLYTLDCFTAAALGLPKLLREEDVQTEYPFDVDDEYTTEEGFQPTLPGEYTRISSALALFRASRILARILEKSYPALATYELSLQQMGAFAAELDDWYRSLPAHLRLTFSQDKPSTDVTSSRSPVLALAYHYMRSLVHRPAVGSSLGPRSASALLSVAESSKRIIQIVQLLEERSMSFSFCLNKSDVLALCGLTLLYHAVDLKQHSKITRDIERLVNVTIQMLTAARAPACVELARIAEVLIPAEKGQSPSPSSMPAPPHRPSSKGSRRKDPGRAHEKSRRMTPPDIGPSNIEFPAPARRSFDSDTAVGQPCQHRSAPEARDGGLGGCRPIPNLDYLSLNNTPDQTGPSSPIENVCMATPGSTLSPSSSQMLGSDSTASRTPVMPNPEWEVILGSIDGGLNNVYDAIYGGGNLINGAPHHTQPSASEWSPEAWDVHCMSAGDLGRNAAAAGPQSVLSLSDESLSSGEDVAPSDLGLSVNVGSGGFSKLAVPEAFSFDMHSFSY